MVHLFYLLFMSYTKFHFLNKELLLNICTVLGILMFLSAMSLRCTSKDLNFLSFLLSFFETKS